MLTGPCDFGRFEAFLPHDFRQSYLSFIHGLNLRNYHFKFCTIKKEGISKQLLISISCQILLQTSVLTVYSFAGQKTYPVFEPSKCTNFNTHIHNGRVLSK